MTSVKRCVKPISLSCRSSLAIIRITKLYENLFTLKIFFRAFDHYFYMAVFIATYFRTKQLVSDHRELSGLFLDLSKQAENALGFPVKVCSLTSAFQGNVKKKKKNGKRRHGLTCMFASAKRKQSRFDSYSVRTHPNDSRYLELSFQLKRHQ